MIRMMNENDKLAGDLAASQACDLVGGPTERRERLARARRFASEVDNWPSWKLRAAYAQPEKVQRAEERERREGRSTGK